MIPLTLKINKNKALDKERAIRKAVEILKRGGLVIHPTDTCYGIAADPSSRRAIRNVYRFKGRDYKKPLFIIVKDLKSFKKYGKYCRTMEKVLNKYPNSQFTFITKKKDTVPSFLNPGYETIGIQIPKIDFSLSLLSIYGRPLIGTSANHSGMKECYTSKGLTISIGNEYDFPILILDYGTLPKRPVSNVIEVCNNGIKLIRCGDLKEVTV